MYLDAVKDGIRIENPQRSGELAKYYPKCCICGNEMLVLNYKRGVRYVCKKCKAKAKLRDRNTKINEDYDLKEQKFDRAVGRISKMLIGKRANKEEYKIAAEKIHRKLHRPLWFQSTEEIMVAIQLVKDKIPTRHQVKFGKYRADFVLPDEKVVLEVDGTPFHNEKTATKESMRDSLITIALGPNWEVVRISDQLINENITKLVEAIRKARDHRKLLRNQHGGEIPEWYSKKIV
jgi:very-short-patch-repair endonuclease